MVIRNIEFSSEDCRKVRTASMSPSKNILHITHEPFIKTRKIIGLHEECHLYHEYGEY